MPHGNTALHAPLHLLLSVQPLLEPFCQIDITFLKEIVYSFNYTLNLVLYILSRGRHHKVSQSCKPFFSIDPQQESVMERPVVQLLLYLKGREVTNLKVEFVKGSIQTIDDLCG